MISYELWSYDDNRHFIVDSSREFWFTHDSLLRKINKAYSAAHSAAHSDCCTVQIMLKLKNQVIYKI